MGIALLATALVAGTCASSAVGSTTIGALAPGTPDAICDASGPVDFIQPVESSGSLYVVPEGGVAITSWSTNAAPGAGQQLKMKVFRRLGTTDFFFQVVAHDGPRNLTPGTVNTFPVNIPIQPGDLLGLNNQNALTVPNACFFPFPGESHIDNGLGGPIDLADGESSDFGPTDMNFRLNISAVVGFTPSNTFKFGKVKRNKRKGTGTIAVDVPGSGTLSLTGKGVKAQRHARGPAVVTRKVTEAGVVNLPVKANGKKKRKLNAVGKVKVKVTVTFTPDGASTGDVAGDPKLETKRLRLVKF